ncbi:MAG TPA: phosphoribosyl 1,2-cyclic phosphodiesterase, partial [Rhodobacteraceae bacterium]|nr:phosphoribosyl 1,2-cyclic phosphodiesterase [Paracoccaceae bacterium]
LTNMHIDMDYDAVARDTPEHVTPAHDGMVIRYPVAG